MASWLVTCADLEAKILRWVGSCRDTFWYIVFFTRRFEIMGDCLEAAAVPIRYLLRGATTVRITVQRIGLQFNIDAKALFTGDQRGLGLARINKGGLV